MDCTVITLSKYHFGAYYKCVGLLHPSLENAHDWNGHGVASHSPEVIISHVCLLEIIGDDFLDGWMDASAGSN